MMARRVKGLTVNEALRCGASHVTKTQAGWQVHAVFAEERPVVEMTADGLEHRDDAGGALSFQVRDDGLIQIAFAKGQTLSLKEGCGEVAFRREGREGCVLASENGGFGFWPTQASALKATRTPTGYEITARNAGVLWLMPLPARSRDHRKPGLRLAHEGRPRPFPKGAYPSDRVLTSIAPHADVMALHAYFWEAPSRWQPPLMTRYLFRRRPWTTSHHRPAFEAEFERVRDRCHELGLRLVVYLSPRFAQLNDPIAEMKRVVEEYRVDGLYLDGLSRDIVVADAMVRGAREALGPEGLLYLNLSDDPFKDAALPAPFLDAQADLVLRGSRGMGGLDSTQWFRWVGSTLDLGNAVGHWCSYGRALWPRRDRPPLPGLIHDALDGGCRIWRRSQWESVGEDLEIFDAEYSKRLEKVVLKEA